MRYTVTHVKEGLGQKKEPHRNNCGEAQGILQGWYNDRTAVLGCPKSLLSLSFWSDYFFAFIGLPQQTTGCASAHPHAVSTDTTMPHTLQPYLAPFLIADFVAGLAAAFTGAFAAFAAGALAAGFFTAAAFAAGFFTAAAFAGTAFFVAILIPPLFCVMKTKLSSIL
jgi:hypothetical protein